MYIIETVALVLTVWFLVSLMTCATYVYIRSMVKARYIALGFVEDEDGYFIPRRLYVQRLYSRSRCA